MSQIKAVLWDIDGTLIDSEPLHAASLDYALNQLGLDVDPADHAQRLGSAAQDVFKQLHETHHLSLTFQEWSQLRTDYYLKFAADLKVRGAALDVYHELNERGIPQGFVSNSNKRIVMANLLAIGLSDPEVIAVSRNDVLAGKPSPEPYQRGAYLLGADSRECIALEDSTTGSQAGLAAGCKTLIWPEQPVAIPQGAIAISDIREVMHHLVY